MKLDPGVKSQLTNEVMKDIQDEQQSAPEYDNLAARLEQYARTLELHGIAPTWGQPPLPPQTAEAAKFRQMAQTLRGMANDERRHKQALDNFLVVLSSPNI
jgi:hypothetical protein